MLTNISFCVGYIGLVSCIMWLTTCQFNSTDEDVWELTDPCSCALIFREIDEGLLYGEEAGFIADEVPGFDHVALLVMGKVYENHPGYGTGIYTSTNSNDTVEVSKQSGIQWNHTLASFSSYVHNGSPSIVKSLGVKQIPCKLAAAMESFILANVDMPYGHFDYSSSDIASILSPPGQKGKFGTYTCSGLIERAAEAVGHKDGQGFVANHLESLILVNPWTMLPLFQVPLLRPQMIWRDAVLVQAAKI